MLPSGHALTHILQPMHFLSSIATSPSAVFVIASVGHTLMQDGSSHCMHIMGTDTAASSYVNTETLEFFVLKALIFVKEHTSSQVLQPMHFSGEIIRILLTSLRLRQRNGRRISPPPLFIKKSSPAAFGKNMPQAANELLCNNGRRKDYSSHPGAPQPLLPGPWGRRKTLYFFEQTMMLIFQMLL